MKVSKEARERLVSDIKAVANHYGVSIEELKDYSLRMKWRVFSTVWNNRVFRDSNTNVIKENGKRLLERDENDRITNREVMKGFEGTNGDHQETAIKWAFKNL